MKSKSIEKADYKEIGFGTGLFPYAQIRCQAAGVPIYWPHHHRQWEYGSALTEYFNIFKDTRTSVLDLGCGSSILGPSLLLRTRATVHEVDPDARLQEARENMADRFGLPPERYRLTIAGILDMPDTTQYDAVFCMSVIEHLPEEDQNAAWTKVASLVKPGGLLVLTTDFGPDIAQEWTSDSEREVKFDPTTIVPKAELLRSLGFNFDLDPSFKGPEVYDYTFFRIVARKRAGSGL